MRMLFTLLSLFLQHHKQNGGTHSFFFLQSFIPSFSRMSVDQYLRGDDHIHFHQPDLCGFIDKHKDPFIF